MSKAQGAILCVLALAVSFSSASTQVASGQSIPCQRPGKILIIRGVLNVFSLGCDSLGKKLSRLGYDVTVTSPSLAAFAAKRIRDEYIRNPHSGPIVIIGHSMGGRLCIHLSRMLRGDHIPVKLVVIADSNPVASVPDNVERCVNLFVTNAFGLFHGKPVKRECCTTELINADMTRVKRPCGIHAVDHFNIEAHEWIHHIIICEIAKACSCCDDNYCLHQCESWGAKPPFCRPEAWIGCAPEYECNCPCSDQSKRPYPCLGPADTSCIFHPSPPPMTSCDGPSSGCGCPICRDPSTAGVVQ